MNPEKISELLPAFGRSEEPDAYQVIGLTGPEPDMNRVLSAIKKTIERLKSLKDQTPPDVWAQAASAVRQAKETLADPVQKAELDQKLRSQKNIPASNPVEFDPLAGILPTTDPLKRSVPAPSPESVSRPPKASNQAVAADIPVPAMPGGSRVVSPSPVVSQPPVSVPSQVPAAVPPPTPVVFVPPGFEDSPNVEIPSDAAIVRPRQPRRRRRGSPLMTCLFALVTLSLVAIVCFLGYFLFFQKGAIAISKSGEEVVVTSEPIRTDSQTVINPPRKVEGQQPRDPVLNSPFSGESPLRPLPGEDGNALDPEVMGNLETMETMPDQSTMVPEESTSTMSSDPSSTMPAEPMTPTDTPPVTPNMESPTVEPTSTTPMPTPTPQTDAPDPEQIKKNTVAINEAMQLIRDRDWQRMVSSAERLREMPLNEEQNRMVEGLYDTAFLFEFYRGGIERGMSKQQLGMSFEIIPGFTVGVASAREGVLELKIDGRVQRFELDTFPFNLADRLAAQAIDEGPTRELASAIYHCLAANSTEEVQQSELAWIRGFGQPIEDVDPKQVADTIEAILGGR